MEFLDGVVVDLSAGEWNGLREDCQEIVQDEDGTMVYVFDEFGNNSVIRVSKEADEKAAAEYAKLHPVRLAKVLPFIIPKKE